MGRNVMMMMMVIIERGVSCPIGRGGVRSIDYRFH